MIGAAYIRVSTNDQLEYSPDAQKRAILTFAKQNGIKIPDSNFFIDEGISGRDAKKRPAFMEMIRRSKSKDCEWECIIVHKFDRFARNRQDSIVYKSLLRKEHNIKVLSVTEHLEDDKMSVIMEAILEAMAEYYSLNLSDEVKKGMSEKARKGQWQGKPPYGYNVVNSVLIPDPVRSLHVKEMFDMYTNNIGAYKIATYFNQKGVLTPENNLFENRAIKNILRNEAYIGVVKWNPLSVKNPNRKEEDTIRVEDAHEAIIDKDTFFKAKAILDRNKLDRYHKPNNDKVHWLVGIVKCSNCGSSLVSASRKYKSLQCTRYAHSTCNVSHATTYIKMENTILSALKDFLNGADFDYEIIHSDNKNVEIERIKAELNTLQKREQRAKNAYLNEIDTLEEYSKTKKEISVCKINLENKLKLLEKTLINDTKNIMTNKMKKVYDILISDTTSLDDKNIALKSICQKAIYNKKEERVDLYLYLSI